MFIFLVYFVELMIVGKLGIGLYSIYYCWGRFIILVFKVIVSYKFILLVFYLILVIFFIGGGMIFLFVMKYFVW